MSRRDHLGYLVKSQIVGRQRKAASHRLPVTCETKTSGGIGNGGKARVGRVCRDMNRHDHTIDGPCRRWNAFGVKAHDVGSELDEDLAETRNEPRAIATTDGNSVRDLSRGCVYGR